MPTELVAALSTLRDVYASGSVNYRLLTSAVRHLELLYAREQDSKNSAGMQSMIIQEQAGLISKLRNGMELARLAMSQA